MYTLVYVLQLNSKWAGAWKRCRMVAGALRVSIARTCCSLGLMLCLISFEGRPEV